MQDWTNIIKEAEKQKLITPKEATELHAEHGSIKTGFAKKLPFRKMVFNKMKPLLSGKDGKGGLKYLVEHPGYIVLGALAADMAGATAKSVTAPVRSKINYTSMKEELERISPGITKKHDDAHIKKIYSAVMKITPALSNNPLVAAVLVRDNIDMPQAMNYAHIQSLSQIQSNMAKQQAPSSGALRQISTSFAGPTIKQTSDAYSKDLSDEIKGKRIAEALLAKK